MCWHNFTASQTQATQQPRLGENTLNTRRATLYPRPAWPQRAEKQRGLARPVRGAATIAVGPARQWQQRDGRARPNAIASAALCAEGRRALGGDEGPALRAARPSAQPARARCQPPLPQYFTALQQASRRWPASLSALPMRAWTPPPPRLTRRLGPSRAGARRTFGPGRAGAF